MRFVNKKVGLELRPQMRRAGAVHTRRVTAPRSSRCAGSARSSPTGVVALATFDLDVRDGEFLTLLGPSGCGKSTVLRLIAGLASPTAGAIDWRAPRAANNIGFVFQECDAAALGDVFDNVYLPLRLAGVSREAAAPLVARRSRSSALPTFERALPRELSGGMRMRVRHRPRAGDAADAAADGRAFRRARRGDALPAQRRSARAEAPVRHDDRLRHPFGLRERLSLDAHRRDVAARAARSSTRSRSIRRSRATTIFGRAELSPTCAAGASPALASQSKRRRRDPGTDARSPAATSACRSPSSSQRSPRGKRLVRWKHSALYSPGAELISRRSSRIATSCSRRCS